MSAGNDRNVFDDLNNVLFAQIDKLQSIDPTDQEQMEHYAHQRTCDSCLGRSEG